MGSPSAPSASSSASLAWGVRPLILRVAFPFVGGLFSVWTCVLCCVDSFGCWGKPPGENWNPCVEGSAVPVSSPRPMVYNRSRPSLRRLDCCPCCPSSSVLVRPVELHSVGCGSCTMGVQVQKACPASPLWMLHCCCCLCSQVN